MRPPKSLRSLSAAALAKAHHDWDERLADEIEKARAKDPVFRLALDTTLDIEAEIERRAQ